MWFFYALFRLQTIQKPANIFNNNKDVSSNVSSDVSRRQLSQKTLDKFSVIVHIKAMTVRCQIAFSLKITVCSSDFFHLFLEFLRFTTNMGKNLYYFRIILHLINIFVNTPNYSFIEQTYDKYDYRMNSFFIHIVYVYYTHKKSFFQ